MEEQEGEGGFHDYYVVKEPIPVCKCLTSIESSDKPPINLRKQQIYTAVSRTEAYLKDRRIPELIRYLMTKIIASESRNPVLYMESLLDDCMLYRSGLGQPPVLYERRHLEAVVKSFDPGNRGWLSLAQIRRAFATLGLMPPEHMSEEHTPVDVVLKELEKAQDKHLYQLLTAGTDLGRKSSSTSSEAPDSITIFQNCFNENRE